MTWQQNPVARAQLVAVMRLAGRRLTPQEIATKVHKDASTILQMLNALHKDGVVDRKALSCGPLAKRVHCNWGLTGKPLPDVQTSTSKYGVEQFSARALACAWGMPLAPPLAANARVVLLGDPRK